jgi:hypothetical protein
LQELQTGNLFFDRSRFDPYAAAWEAQGLVFSQKITEMIKHRGDKGRTYDVIPLDWGINNYDVYNRNGLIETVIFYTYIIFYLILNNRDKGVK